MRPVSDKHENKNRAAVVEAVKQNEEALKVGEKTGLKPRNPHTMKYIQRKLEEKGVQRFERHPGDGTGIKQPPPKSGHGGKYTWEGPDDVAENELEAVPQAIDERDPNYVNEEEEVKEIVGKSGGDDEVAELVVGEVEVAKAAEDREGVARLEVDPKLNVD